MKFSKFDCSAENKMLLEFSSRGIICAIIFFLLIVTKAESQSMESKNLHAYYAVMPLVGQGIDSTAAHIVTDVLINELIGSGKIRVMERSQMNSLLKEQGFQKSGSCDGAECAIEIGRLLAVDRLVVGTLGKLGEAYVITARIVNVETGEIIGGTREQLRGDIDQVASAAVPKVVASLLQFRLGKSQPAPKFDSAASRTFASKATTATPKIEVSVRNGSPDLDGTLKPRIALANRSSEMVNSVRLRWPFTFPPGKMIVDVYYAPKCEAQIDRRGLSGALLVTCSDINLMPGQSWPSPDGLSLGIRAYGSKRWCDPDTMGLDFRMRTRSDIQVEVVSSQP